MCVCVGGGGRIWKGGGVRLRVHDPRITQAGEVLGEVCREGGGEGGVTLFFGPVRWVRARVFDRVLHIVC